MDQDDDIDTDEETLISGIQQCHHDLRQLKHQVFKTKNFRAETSVVQRWKKKGFTFSEDATRVFCTFNFDC